MPGSGRGPRPSLRRPPGRAVQFLHSIQLDELQLLLSIDRPTEILEKVFAALLILVSPYEPSEVDCSWVALREWVTALKGAKYFLSNLRAFNPLTVLSRNVEACLGFLASERLNQIKLQRFSPSLVALHQWVMAVCEERKVALLCSFMRRGG
jgi:hypothetical protein